MVINDRPIYPPSTDVLKQEREKLLTEGAAKQLKKKKKHPVLPDTRVKNKSNNEFLN